MQNVTHPESHSDAGTVGTDAAQLCSQDYPVYKGVFVRADDDNTGIIKVGSESDIAAGRGFPLKAGDSIEIAVDMVSKLFVIADGAAQGYAWLSV